VYKYYKNDKPVKWSEMFENIKCATPRDWRLSDWLDCAEREAEERKYNKLFEYEGDKYVVEWYEYIPDCIKKLGFTVCTNSNGIYWYHGEAEKPLYVNAKAEWFKYGSQSEYQLPIKVDLCKAMIEFFEGLKP